MIGALFTTIYNEIITAFSAVLPASTGLPDNVYNGISYVFGFLNNFSFLIPVSDIFSILQYAIGFEIGILMFKFAKFSLNILRGSGA